MPNRRNFFLTVIRMRNQCHLKLSGQHLKTNGKIGKGRGRTQLRIDVSTAETILRRGMSMYWRRQRVEECLVIVRVDPGQKYSLRNLVGKHLCNDRDHSTSQTMTRENSLQDGDSPLLYQHTGHVNKQDLQNSFNSSSKCARSSVRVEKMTHRDQIESSKCCGMHDSRNTSSDPASHRFTIFDKSLTPPEIKLEATL